MKPVTFLRAALAAGLALGALPQAQAALTAANTTVHNTASVAYKIGTVDQTPVDSNDSTFVVDRVIDVTVTADNTPLPVVPGAPSPYMLSFTVTNASNAALDFDVLAAQTASTTVLAVSATDNLTMTDFSYVVDNGDGVYNAVDDTATTISNLGAGVSRKVFAFAKTPITAANGDIAGVSVLVSATEVGGAALSATAGANTAGMDTVYADGDGPLSETSRDAQISVYGYYLVSSASISLSKSAAVIDDPVNGSTQPKAIPGATVEYCLIVANSGAASASTVVISDNLPAEVTYVTGTLRVGVAGDANSCTTATGSAATDSALDSDGGDFATGGTNGTGVVTFSTPTLAATSGIFRVLFRVTVK